MHRLLVAGLLCERLEALKGAPAPGGGGGELRIDETNQEVWVGTRQVSLTPTEYELLLYLYRRQGELCRRADIVRDVFHLQDPSPDDEASLINTNIGRLRAKVESEPGPPRYIITVRSAGYKLIVRP